MFFFELHKYISAVRELAGMSKRWSSEGQGSLLLVGQVAKEFEELKSLETGTTKKSQRAKPVEREGFSRFLLNQFSIFNLKTMSPQKRKELCKFLWKLLTALIAALTTAIGVSACYTVNL